MKEKKQILIIGGSSFVARNFIRLQSNNYRIRVVSRSNTGHSDELIYNDFFSIPQGVFDKIDVIINCAAIVHQQQKINETIYQKINYELVVNLAKKAKKSGVNTFIQMSTIAVYGNQTHITPKSKEKPINPYGKSKLEADKALLELSDDYFKVIIFRPPMIYGGKDAPGNMIRLINIIAKGIPLPFKKLKNKRDFIHIDNLIAFINASITRGGTGVYLVSDNSPVYISKLYKVIVNALGQRSKAFGMPSLGFKLLKIVVPSVYDKLFGNLTIDATESIKNLGYKPKEMLEKGIIEMVKGINH